jgi:hypothetical protein
VATPAPLAGVEELADWIGEPIPENSAEAKRAALALRAASALVREESGRTWLDDAGVLVANVPDNAVMVTLYCAGRVFDNREAQIRGGIDDASDGWLVQESGAYLTASERQQLSGLKGSSNRGIGTVATTRSAPAVVGAGWVPTDGGPLFPWY